MNERVPEPDESTLFYWEGARAGRLLIQRCASSKQAQGLVERFTEVFSSFMAEESRFSKFNWLSWVPQ